MTTQPTVTSHALIAAITLAFEALPGPFFLNVKRYGLNAEDASDDEAISFRRFCIMSNWYQAWESLDVLWHDATPNVRSSAIANLPARWQKRNSAGRASSQRPKQARDTSIVELPDVQPKLWDEFKQLASGALVIPRKGSPS